MDCEFHVPTALGTFERMYLHGLTLCGLLDVAFDVYESKVRAISD